jgi:hypothetical protein
VIKFGEYWRRRYMQRHSALRLANYHSQKA